LAPPKAGAFKADFRALNALAAPGKNLGLEKIRHREGLGKDCPGKAAHTKSRWGQIPMGPTPDEANASGVGIAAKGACVPVGVQGEP
jgi:hypothetical protein